ncbi:MAG: PEP-CTERM sorting domain-containing protein [Planctomycetaceae bacterium]|nr:PEP-CTERM sorting domain-containing protein [Planctomycetaceae bacterium]
MKNLLTICAIIGMVLAVNGLAQAAETTWEVATVQGLNQFSISPDGSLLHYDQQPRNTNEWYWYNNNGSPAGTLATGGFQTPNGYRDGSRTFATTNVAVGQTLNNIKLAFDYKTALGYVTINYFLTDGNGKFGIFAPTSLGIAGVSTTQVVDSEWSRITLDLTAAIPDSTSVAMYEHNGLAVDKVEPFTTMQWGDIKDLTIAGMYDYQRSPSLGWDYWGEMFDQINTAGNSTIINGYGMALIWGDTVGNTTYATQSREIRNLVVSFDGTDYTGTFESAQIPEPATMAMLGLGALSLIRRKK